MICSIKMFCFGVVVSRLLEKWEIFYFAFFFSGELRRQKKRTLYNKKKQMFFDFISKSAHKQGGKIKKFVSGKNKCTRYKKLIKKLESYF